ncbi:hypothetical protein [Spirulina sp. 06S082]|uniref:hypothetical protein n=1 Tax=Spirulina sp. 06S082 TaxID=3110248 RepID=UPI002B1F46B2|nr:hypothetical protein [Spirulina sp. 06S082]MEA5467539.1 hypothetical protein [Spirulina sp. 06S082]
MDEIAKQAHEGSVAAIVQIMNDRLADMGVRTRAVLEKGILQVLCEAKESEQLEQSVLIEQLQEILEAIEPQNLRRVNICSRIANEQQLVWLEDVHHNPENQLLWSQEIVLRKASTFQNWFRKENKSKQSEQKSTAIQLSSNSSPPSSSKVRNIVGMLLLCTVSFLAGLAYNNWRAQNLDFSQLAGLFPFFKSSVSSVSPAAPVAQTTESPTDTPAASPTPAVSPTPSPLQTETPTTVVLPAPGDSNAPATTEDPFSEAVRLAEEVSLKGQTAQTKAEWLNLSAQWQKASELMNSVAQDDPRYDVARDRVEFYQKNSEVARTQAQKQDNN